MGRKQFLTENERRRLKNLLEWDKPSSEQVQPFVRALYDVHPNYGSLSVVLDDGDIEDNNVDFCVEWAQTHKDPDGELLARVVRKMTKKERKNLW